MSQWLPPVAETCRASPKSCTRGVDVVEVARGGWALGVHQSPHLLPKWVMALCQGKVAKWAAFPRTHLGSSQQGCCDQAVQLRGGFTRKGNPLLKALPSSFPGTWPCAFSCHSCKVSLEPHGAEEVPAKEKPNDSLPLLSVRSTQNQEQ